MQLSNWRGEIHREVTGLLRELLAEGIESGYTLEDARSCGAVLNAYVEALEKANGQEEILASIREAVTALNECNERTGVLKTAARESVLGILQGAALEAGLWDTEVDITEDWRTW